MTAPRRPQLANGLHWLRFELEQSLSRVRSSLEHYLEAPGDRQPLLHALEELRLVRGGVGIVECHGARLLAEEMIELLQELLDDRVRQTDEAFAALSGAALQLFDYLDLLSDGEEDRVLVLQPLVNELRLARGQPVLTEGDLLAYQLRSIDAARPPEPPAEAAALQAAQNIARRELPGFQLAFLQWFRGQNADAALQRLAGAAARLANAAAERPMREFWTAAAALAEALPAGAPQSLDLKRLFGRAGTLLKLCAEQGEAAALAQLGDARDHLLLHLGRLPQAGRRGEALVERYRLDTLLPGADALEGMRRRLRGPNTTILDRVCEELRRDFAPIKDAIDLAMRTGGRVPIDGEAIGERLQRLSTTVGVLGLPAPQQALQNQVQAVHGLAPDDPAWIDVATAILRVELALEEALFRSQGRYATQPARSYADIERETPPSQDQRDAVRSLLRESLVNLARLKTAVDNLLKGGDVSGLAPVPALLHEIAAGLQLLQQPRGAELLTRIEDYVARGGLAGLAERSDEAEHFADAIAGVEMLIEALREGSPQLPRLLDALDGFVARLGTPSPGPVAAAPQPPAEAAPPSSAADDDPEIRAVFLEEAAAVLAALQRQVPQFRQQPQNRELLSDLRRGFHTLKGSGRMVGASHVGALGWAVERMLNQCLEGALQVRAPVLETLQGATALLPAVIAAFRDGVEPPESLAALVQRADELASGYAPDADLLKVFREDARDRLAAVGRWLEAQDLRRSGFTVPVELVRAFHTLRGAASVVDAAAVGTVAGAIEGYLGAAQLAHKPLPPSGLTLLADAVLCLRGWVDAHPGPDAMRADASPWLARIEALQAELGAGAEQRRDTVDRYSFEALEHVEAIGAAYAAWQQTPSARPAVLTQQLDALAAIAARSGDGVTARIAHALAKRAGLAPAAVDAGYFTASAKIVECLHQALDLFRNGEVLNAEPVLAQIESLPTAAALAAEIDPELLQIFLGEAAELLGDIDRGVAGWRSAPAHTELRDTVRRAVHTLKGSARMAGLPVIGEQAQQLERLVAAVEDDGALDEALDRVAAGSERLRRMLDDVARGIAPESPLEAEEPSFAAAEPTNDAPPSFAPPSTETPGELPRETPGDSALPAIDLDAGVPLGVPAEAPASEAPASEWPSVDASQADPVVVPLDEPPPDISLPPEPEPAEPEPEPVASLPGSAPFAPPPAEPPRAAGEDLIDIFAAEAAELLEALDGALDAWQGGDEGDAVRDVQRTLHTLKGSARMVGNQAIGTAAHEFETQVESILATGEFPDAATFAALRAAFDRLQALQDGLLEVPPVIAAPEPAVEPGDAALTPEIAASDDPSTAPAWNPELFWQPDELRGGSGLVRRETARVPVEALDRLLNEAGEISIYRSRLEQQSAMLRAQLGEMSQTLNRVRDQLRQLDTETDAQIAARGFADTGAGADRYGTEFDPLEMDRYTRMQELSRALAESVGDMASLRDTIDEVVAESDALLQQQSRIASEVQQGLMGTLMVPFSRQVPRLQRVVVQTARQNGKQAEAVFAGVEAELDRNVLERMTAPLEHLLRNAVVHGIEDAELRLQRGKPATGEIRVSLKREGSQLLVEVADDGDGLDFDAIRRRAVELGLMPADATPADSEIARFIFEPGFSTARALTQDAGRGIGMDVVAAEVKQLGGALELASERGSGARFRVRLPLTLAVSQALLLQLGAEVYAVPLPAIEGIARVSRAGGDAWLAEDAPPLEYGGKPYAIRYLGDLLGLPRQLPTEGRSLTAVLVKLSEPLGGSEKRYALVADQLLGNREIVAKPVGPQIGGIVGVSGATILPDGRVVLILDVPALISDSARRALRAQAIPAAPVDRRELIVVVDDSVTMRRIAERLLTRNGFRVMTALDGLDAMALLQTETPAVVLLDIEMPRADGFEVATFMRNTDRLRAVPIIMITSRSGEKHRERARALSVDRYLIKPYQEDELLAEIQSVRTARQGTT